MSRGLIFLGIVIALFAAAMYWGVPYLQQRFIGSNFTVTVKVVDFVDSDEVELGDALVSRRVVTLDLFFPTNSEPSLLQELEIEGPNGQRVDVQWQRLDTVPLDEQRQVRIRANAFLPIGFAEGVLKKRDRELCKFTVAK